jgi:Tat protein secretion system quality control protein TatD with DNase activity
MRHIARAKMSENYYLDLSGTGLFRHGMLNRAVKEMGADHILFGTDYPICTPGMFVGGVLYDPFLSDEEKASVSTEADVLRAAIEEYNAIAEGANNDLTEATELALSPLSGIVFAALAALIALIKRRFTV